MYISVFPEPVTPCRSTGFSCLNAFCISFRAAFCAVDKVMQLRSIPLVFSVRPSLAASMPEIAMSLASSALAISSRIFVTSSAALAFALVPSFDFSAWTIFFPSLSWSFSIRSSIAASTFSFRSTAFFLASALASSRLILPIG